MTKKTPPLSLVLPSRRLAVLDEAFMLRFFQRHAPRWYPHETVGAVRIDDHSHALYKKSLSYTLTLARGAREREVVVRGNIPSLDTTRESVVALNALTALWDDAPALRTTITRPLGFHRRLRMLLYESVPGAPLMNLLRHRRPRHLVWLRASGAWLAKLHTYHLPVGRFRSAALEQREAGYFAMNYRGFLPSCVDEMQTYERHFFHHRKRLARSIVQSSMLIHGDYNPNNILVDTKTSKLYVIDFGNAWHYSRLSDLANAVVQLGYVNKGDEGERRRLQQVFLRSYTDRFPFRGTDEQVFHLFRLWWSLQTLAFTMTLPLTTPSNIRPALARTRYTLRDAFTRLSV